MEVNDLNYVAQHHVRASDWTLDMCRDYRLTPIVLIRNLLDVVVSLRDHVRKEGHVSPMFFIEPHHLALEDAHLELMIARLAVPWYLNFYLSWRRAPDTLAIRYENLVRTPVAVVSDILAFSGAQIPRETVAAAVESVLSRGKSRLNVGVSGRGASLRPEALRAILDLIELYPEANTDGYLASIRAEALAILAGDTVAPANLASTTGPVRRSTSLRRWFNQRGRRVLVRRVLPVLLMALAAAYWVFPYDLIPDAKPNGYLDDALVLFSLSLLAGRLTRAKVGRMPLINPAVQRLRPVPGGSADTRLAGAARGRRPVSGGRA